MVQVLNSDKPINSKEFDRFDRYKFANRIAETIAKRNSKEGLVIGLYGKWGEGKSSVLNMIENDLTTKNDLLIVKFNPWRFKDEDTLMLNFFQNISAALDKELNSKKEKFGKFLALYGGVGSVVSLDLTKIGETLSDANLDMLKSRVNEFLKESEKKVVVIIDDIDRLDKQELFALFKLIKLTGDFSQTYYILSFDDDMVASAIGERYADGNKIAGYNFLEKIIQVPLRIPQALSKSLLNYTFDLLNDILKTNQIELKDDSTDVGYQITKNISIKINTPRLAIRYANSLTFLVPLLSGEVNICDLILFEGLKLFYPDYYNFIKNSPEYFIESYQDLYNRGSDNAKKEEFLLKIVALNKVLSKREQAAIKDLIKYLFPITNEAFDNYNYSYQDNGWEKEKRIASYKYFHRYFLYSVPKGEISDIYFEGYINKLHTNQMEYLEHETSKLLSDIDPQEFLTKISLYGSNLNWLQRKILIEIICKFYKKLLKTEMESITIFYTPLSSIAKTISELLAKHSNYFERFEFAKNLIKDSVDFDFSYELLRWFRSMRSEDEPFISQDDIIQLEEVLLDRTIAESEKINSSLFQSHSNKIYTLLEMWYRLSPQKLTKYIDDCMLRYKDFQEVMIDELTTEITSYDSISEHYKTDFKKESYDALKQYYDIDKIYKAFSKKKYDKVRELDVKFFDVNKGQSLETAIRQFLYWYDLDQNSNQTVDELNPDL